MASLRRIAEVHDVVMVVTRPDRPAGRGRRTRPPPVKLAAAELRLPVVQPASVKKAAFRRELAASGADVAVVAAYGAILGPRLLAVPRLGFWNVHASLLPRWRGASPIQWALLARDESTGVSIMRIVPALDAGPVLSSEAIDVPPDADAGWLTDRLAELGGELAARALASLETAGGAVALTAQDDSRATYAPLLRKEDGRLDWGEPAAELEARVRAFHPWPGAFATWNGRPLKILQARAMEPAAAANVAPPGQSTRPGTVLIADPAGPDGVVVQCGERTALALLRLQRPGKSPLEAPAFLRGARLEVGDSLRDAASDGAPGAPDPTESP